ncbi:SPOR domain-containing protein [Weeksella virosa]|uniref:HU domain-containing protein n=1 Tax=Weeksella virosa TaxID=1014 RepID=UPI0025565815|nr:SPOR domain-containing protein [Weeksella virosa]MDK7676094.1 SPOR domain-containing protein [Weeksella virosa]
MKIEQLIHELLYEHNCVIVPDFGAFITQTYSAKKDKEAQNFLPPSKTVSFNASIQKQDGLLINALMRKQSMSQEKALETIQNQVRFWQEHLQAGKELSLIRLGKLQQNVEGNLVFTPEDTNFLLSSFGLPAVHAPYVLQTEIEKEKPNRYAGLLAAASFLPILIGGFLYFNTPQPVKAFVDEQWSGIVLPMFGKEKVNHKVIHPTEKSIHHLPNIMAEETTLVASNTTKNNETVVVKTKETTGKYQVVAGSYKRLDEAQEAIEKLHKKGFDKAGMVYKKGSFFYVNYMTFETEEGARAYLNWIHEQNKDAWIRKN